MPPVRFQNAPIQNPPERCRLNTADDRDCRSPDVDRFSVAAFSIDKEIPCSVDREPMCRIGAVPVLVLVETSHPTRQLIPDQ